MKTAGRAAGVSSFPSCFANNNKTGISSSSCSLIPVVCSSDHYSLFGYWFDNEEEEEAPAKAKPKPKPAAKAPVKPLPQLMEEEVIPLLKSTLQVQDDISQLQLSFQDNTLEGSFVNKDVPYYFWAFFPDGILTGSRGFSLSSYGQGPSTVEPFLIDEKKITAKHVVFWVEKRLAAQGIIPV
ncbi:hypothetical protein LINPERHAP1_LOCUS15420 [Linum perenne]